MTTLVKLNLRAKHQKYVGKNGEEYPGVTTKLRVFAKEALYQWHGTEERAGILRLMRDNELAPEVWAGKGKWTADALEAALPVTSEGKPKLFAITKRDTAGDIGTIAHAMVDAHYIDADISPEGLDPTQYEQAGIVARRYISRLAENDYKLVASELQMVSEKYRTGGTGDRFFRKPDGKLVYRDLKTSGPWYEGVPYDDTIAQGVAYATFYEELYGERVEEIWVDRTGKTASDPGDFWPLDETERILGLRLFEDANKSFEDKWLLKQHLKTKRTR